MIKNQELEFLPAVLEIQETPPSPLGRAIAWTLIAFFTIAVIWACIGKVDIVAVAQGKIIPGDRIKVIQPLEIGTVRTIHVHEGQAVTKGDLLVELDATASGADRQRLSEQLMTAKIEAARWRALSALEFRDEHRPFPAFAAPPQAHAAQMAVQQRLLQNQIAEYTARLSEIHNTIEQRRAEQAGAKETVAKLEATLPLVAKRADALKNLADKKLASEHSYLELEQQRIEQQQDLAIQRNRLQETASAIAGAEQQRLALQAEFKRTALTELAKAEEAATSLTQELVKAEQRTTLQHLIAPVSGVVQQLAVHTVGGVVTPAQQLMVVVPKEHALEIEALVKNQDIGFVRDGQIAEVKVETFPFTRYGTIDAQLLHVSNDAIADEKLGLVYSVRVLMKKSVMNVEGKRVNLTPGMAVTVEVKTGKRRLIEYFLSPLLQYAKESVRER
ncbi:MAG: HlyD family type I secretion periplasmic adaptor subunit [Gammaproteobacteria bacterium]